MPIKIDRELINKIIGGTYSEEELADFLEQVRSMDKASFMEAYQLLYQEIGSTPSEEFTPGFKERLEQRLDALEKSENFLPDSPGSEMPERSISMPRRKWWNYASAAAVLILLFGAGSYFLFFRKERKESAQSATQELRFKNDVPPGHQGAVLTLSNGQKIVLDNAGNGLVASDKGMRVIKKDGQINYAGRTGETETVYNHITTPKGRQWQLTLSDGTQVWLNAASSISYPLVFTGKERKVEITGEAYFEVAKNAAMPFKVKILPLSGDSLSGERDSPFGGQGAGEGGEVEVLGTHFDINAYGDENTIRTTLLEGSVKVSANNRSSGQLSDSQPSVVLMPGQQAQIGRSGVLKVIRDADMEETIAWKNGRFLFNADIGTIMRQIAKWYDVEVVYKDRIEDPYSMDISRNVPVSQLLKYMELSGGVHFEIEGKKVTVRK
jgi:transmembrane sensor